MLPVHLVDELAQVLDERGDLALAELAAEPFQALRQEVLDDEPILLIGGSRPGGGCQKGHRGMSRCAWRRFNSLRLIIFDPTGLPNTLGFRVKVAYPAGHHRTTTDRRNRPKAATGSKPS